MKKTIKIWQLFSSIISPWCWCSLNHYRNRAAGPKYLQKYQNLLKLISQKFAQRLVQLKIVNKSPKPQVGSIIFLFPKSLATNINKIRKISCLINITQLSSLDILKTNFGCNSLFFRPFLVNLKITLKRQLTSFTRFNYKALRLYYIKRLAVLYLQKISHLVIYNFCLYMHLLDYSLLYFLSYLCDFSPILCSLFQSNPINYEVWKNFSSSKLKGFQLSSISLGTV